jgi:hypothetical protein
MNSLSQTKQLYTRVNKKISMDFVNKQTMLASKIFIDFVNKKNVHWLCKQAKMCIDFVNKQNVHRYWWKIIGFLNDCVNKQHVNIL